MRARNESSVRSPGVLQLSHAAHSRREPFERCGSHLCGPFLKRDLKNCLENLNQFIYLHSCPPALVTKHHAGHIPALYTLANGVVIVVVVVAAAANDHAVGPAPVAAGRRRRRRPEPAAPHPAAAAAAAVGRPAGRCRRTAGRDVLLPRRRPHLRGRGRRRGRRRLLLGARRQVRGRLSPSSSWWR